MLPFGEDDSVDSSNFDRLIAGDLLPQGSAQHVLTPQLWSPICHDLCLRMLP